VIKIEFLIGLLLGWIIMEIIRENRGDPDE